MLPNYFRMVVSFWLVLGGCVLGLWSYNFWAKERLEKHHIAQQQLAKQFVISDFCLSTESRHVRHVAMPEWIAPFQDFPGYHEHFPSSSFFQLTKQEVSNPKKR